MKIIIIIITTLIYILPSYCSSLSSSYYSISSSFLLQNISNSNFYSFLLNSLQKEQKEREEEREKFLDYSHSILNISFKLKQENSLNILLFFNFKEINLKQRNLNLNCDLVTWIINFNNNNSNNNNNNNNTIGQVTCLYSFQLFNSHCDSICKFPTINQLQSYYNNKENNKIQLSFESFLNSLIPFLDLQQNILPVEITLISSSPSDNNNKHNNDNDNSNYNLNRKLRKSPTLPPSSSSIQNPSLFDYNKKSYTITSPQKLFSSNGQSYDNFGTSLGYHNDIAIVGAITRDYGGRVYMYYREGDHFIQDPLLLTGYPPTSSSSSSSTSTSTTTTSTAPKDFFGWSIDIYDRTIAVGAYQTLLLSSQVQSVGAVYIFYQLSSGWNIESFLRVNTAQTNSRENTNNNNNNNNKNNQNNNENNPVEITPHYDHFGWSLSLYESNLIVGAYGDDDRGTSSGAVYSFERIDQMRYHWTVTQKLLARDASNYDNFGWSVSLHKNITVIGAYGDSVQGQPYLGSIYIFERKNYHLYSSLWTQTQKLLSPDYRSNSFFGWSVSVWDNLIVVGSKSNGADNKGNSNGGSGGSSSINPSSGSVYLYRYSINDNEWLFEKKLIPPSGKIVNNYGSSVDIYENNIIVGAYNELIGVDTTTITTSGSAFVYTSQYDNKYDSVDWFLLNELTSNSTLEKNLKFGSSVKIYDDVILVGAILGDGEMVDTGTVYVFIKSIDIHALGHPLSERTYFTLVLYLPLLSIGMCLVITLARIFMKPKDLTTNEDEINDSNHSVFSYYNDNEVNSYSFSDILYGKYHQTYDSSFHSQSSQSLSPPSSNHRNSIGNSNHSVDQSNHSFSGLIRFHSPRIR